MSNIPSELYVTDPFKLYFYSYLVVGKELEIEADKP